MSEPIHIISLGAGVQSSTMALMAAHREITPMPECAIFADTQDEPAEVYAWLDFLEKKLPYPVYRVTNGSLGNASLRVRHIQSDGWKLPKGAAYINKLIPMFGLSPDGTRTAALGRKCTFDYKIKPLVAKTKEIAGIKRGQKTIGVIKWIGISRDEAHRMKPSKEVWAEHRYPLVDAGITRAKCLTWMKEQGYPEPPRSACRYCPFHNDAEWRRIKAMPEEWEKVVTFERELRRKFRDIDQTMNMEVFLHSSCKPIDEVIFKGEGEDPQLSLFGNECTGMCGV